MIEINAWQTVSYLFADLADGVVRRGPKAAVVAFVDGFRADIRRAFNESIEPRTGKPMLPLKWRVGGKPLVHTGRLFGRTIEAVDAALTAPTPGRGISIQLNDDIAAFQNFGTRTIPPREFFAPSPKTIAAAGTAYQAALTKVTLNAREIFIG